MRTNLILRAAALAVAISGSAFAANRTWTGNSSGIWSDPTNWDGGVSIPAAGDDLIFSSSINKSITIDVPTPTIGALQFTVSGGGYSFGPTGSSITLGGNIFANAPLGVGNVEIFNNDFSTGGNPQNFAGAPTIGPITINGIISGAGLITASGGIYSLTNATNTYSGGTTVTSTGNLVLASTTAAPNVVFTAAATTTAGNGGAFTINGGVVSVAPTGSGNVQLGRIVTFGANGGILDLRNTGGTATTASITGNLPLITTNGGAAGIIKFNGGSNGLSSNNAANPGDWQAGQNNLRIASIVNSGPLAFEISSGALVEIGTPFNTYAGPVSISGHIGGDTSANSIEKTVGRAQLTQGASNVYTLAAGVTFGPGATQFSSASASKTLISDIFVTSGAQVAFAGRGTGTAVVNPQTQQMILGNPAAINAKLLDVQSGGTVVFDDRYRTDVAAQNGVQIFSKTNIAAGAKVVYKQSWAFTVGGAPTATNAVGYIDHQGDIVANGTSANESVIDIQLPFDDGGANGNGLNAMGGVTFNTPGATGVDLVINGAGTGGLRVNGLARDTRAYTVSPMLVMPANTLVFPTDPVSNADKVANLLSAARLAALTGSGGYLTPAPQGATFNFPAAGEWGAAVLVSLKVIDNNASGADVALAAGFNHNVLLSGGDLAAAGNSFGGVLWGAGTVSGNFTMAATGTISPGDGVGIITSNGDASLINDSDYIEDILGATAGTQYDQLLVNGSVNLDSDLTVALGPGFTPTVGQSFTIISNDGIDPVTGIFNGLPQGAIVIAAGSSQGFSINYNGGNGNDVVLTAAGVVPEPASMALVGLGLTGLLIRRRRR